MSRAAVTVVVPTCNRPDQLARCLTVVCAQAEALESVEICVCDDSADEMTRAMVVGDFPDVRWVRGPGRGPGPNRNAGVRNSSAPWLVFVDDDCIPQPGWLGGYVAVFGSGGTDDVLVGPTLRKDEHATSILWEAPEHLKAGDLPPSCNFAIRRAVFERTGGFDERFRYSFEDIELFARLKHSGVTFGFVPAAAVEHPSRPVGRPIELAKRWESRAISTLDFGANRWQLLVGLPRHVLAVIVSRFRGRGWDGETLRAGIIYLQEFLWFLVMLPLWVVRFGGAKRSAFWTEQVRLGRGPVGFGL